MQGNNPPVQEESIQSVQSFVPLFDSGAIGWDDNDMLVFADEDGE